jgi:YD repeat-containing protein
LIKLAPEEWDGAYAQTTLIGYDKTSTVNAYPGTSNRLTTVTRAALTIRAFTYDGGGNILSDSRAGTSYD